jgi:hypothetical protein
MAWRAFAGVVGSRRLLMTRLNPLPRSARISSALDLPGYKRLADPQVVHQHLRRIESSVSGDPAAAIGASKELVESVCKVILDDYGLAHGNKDGVTQLFKKVSVALKIDHECVANHPDASRAAHKAVSGMAGTVQAIAAGVLAAIVPARRASRINVLNALQYE